MKTSKGRQVDERALRILRMYAVDDLTSPTIARRVGIHTTLVCKTIRDVRLADAAACPGEDTGWAYVRGGAVVRA